MYTFPVILSSYLTQSRVEPHGHRAGVYEHVQLAEHVRAHYRGLVADDLPLHGRRMGQQGGRRLELHVAPAERLGERTHGHTPELRLLQGEPFDWRGDHELDWEAVRGRGCHNPRTCRYD
jgi:hypothetical protein